MRIGIDARGAVWYRGSGIGTYTYQLIRSLHLVDRINHYTLFVPGDAQVNITPGENLVLDVCKEKQKGFWDAVKAPVKWDDGYLDVCHIPHNGIGIGDNMRTRSLVVTIHDLIPFIMPQACSPEYLRTALGEVPRAVKHADIVITVSYNSRKDLIEVLSVPPEKIVVTYEAPEDFYRPIERRIAKAVVAEKYGISFRYILYVGGFSLRKNVTGLVEAFASAVPKLPRDVRLVIAGRPGGGSYERAMELAEMFKVSGRVVFTGFVPVSDMVYLYNAAEVFAYPSYYEGFGLPPLEAMACGVPVITASTSSIPEVVDGAAALIDPYDVEALGREIISIVHDTQRAKRLSSLGLARASRFSWLATAQQTLMAYEVLGAGYRSEAV